MNRAAGAASEGSLDSGAFLLEDVMKQYTRQPRKDLRKQMVHPEAGPQPCDACKCSPCSDGCEAWHGLRAAVLCIGLDEYKHLSNLRNAKRDAYEIQRRVNALPRCRAEVIAEQCASNGQELRKGIRRFLKRTGMKESPPEVVLTIYSGHGMEKQGSVYLLHCASVYLLHKVLYTCCIALRTPLMKIVSPNMILSPLKRS